MLSHQKKTTFGAGILCGHLDTETKRAFGVLLRLSWNRSKCGLETLVLGTP